MVAVLAAHHLQTDEAGGGMNRRRLSLATCPSWEKEEMAARGVKANEAVERGQLAASQLLNLPG